MALISCPDCGAKVSDRADRCPKCACPIAHSIIVKEDRKASHSVELPLDEVQMQRTLVASFRRELDEMKRKVAARKKKNG